MIKLQITFKNIFYHILHSALSPSDKDDGFTLIEVLLAAVILGMAYVAVLQSFSQSMRNITRIDNSRTGVFAEVLAFEESLREIDTEDGEIDTDDLPVFLEGDHLRLVELTTENGLFKTLLLEKL